MHATRQIPEHQNRTHIFNCSTTVAPKADRTKMIKHFRATPPSPRRSGARITMGGGDRVSPFRCGRAMDDRAPPTVRQRRKNHNTNSEKLAQRGSGPRRARLMVKRSARECVLVNLAGRSVPRLPSPRRRRLLRLVVPQLSDAGRCSKVIGDQHLPVSARHRPDSHVLVQPGLCAEFDGFRDGVI